VAPEGRIEASLFWHPVVRKIIAAFVHLCVLRAELTKAQVHLQLPHGASKKTGGSVSFALPFS
jgi:hypothetical protein